MKYAMNSKISDIVKSLRGKTLVERYAPYWERCPNAMDLTISYYPHARPAEEGATPERMQEFLDVLNALPEVSTPELMVGTSLDDLDNASYFENGIIAPGPLDGIPVECTLGNGSVTPVTPVAPRETLSLDGTWQMAFDINGQADWSRPMDAPVPGSIHTALVNAGVTPDTTFGRNQELARKYSYMDWWLRRRFTVKDPHAVAQLIFEGVCNRCEIYLNGEKISAHEGMFGGPSIDVTGKLRKENELVVRLFAIPFHHDAGGYHDRSRIEGFINNSWRQTVVSNNVYGWHYSCLPQLGIWNSVRLETVPQVELIHPFIATLDHETADMRLSVEYKSALETFEGDLDVIIEPENFEGERHCFTQHVSGHAIGTWLFQFQIPDARLWWPNLLGEQNLYRLTLSLKSSDFTSESIQTTFGIRTVQFIPLGDGPKPDHYNWRFVINGKEAFIRGTGWCTMDAMMDFSRERYDRFLKLAHIQNCQMIRAWGAGMPETEFFYDLCNRYGIMVMQEWPTAWNSHNDQPYEMLEETVRLNTLRIRNHPSLILYCPGNESSNPYGPAIDMMGRYSFELDGTRAFHRGEPFGGSVHNYDSYWGRQPMDVHVNLEGDFFGEFGIACTPCLESVNRYLPDREKNRWPAEKHSAFEFHTPIFGTAFDLSRLSQMSGYFTDTDCDLEQVTIASQLSQVVGIRHTLERARIRYPLCGGALYYKMNDNFPAMSWATVDWYGAPKIAHYVFQKSFASAAAFIWTERMNFAGTARTLPIYIVDDFPADDNEYIVKATVCDGSLKPLQEKTFTLQSNVLNPEQIGTLSLSYEETLCPPILIRIEMSRNSESVFDTFYFYNYEASKGCLFHLPKTQLTVSADDGFAVLKNIGSVPAIGAMVTCPGHADVFTAYENFLWLNPGEEKRISVDRTEGLSAWALNA